MADLYEIPITLAAHPSRIPMRSVTRNGASKSAAGCGCLTLSQDPTRSPVVWAKPFIARRIHMLDVILIAVAFIFFALSVGYAVACDRL
jgi:hypothetical protein